MTRFFVSTDERRHVERVALLLAIPLTFVILIPTLLSVWLVHRESQGRSKENRALIVHVEQSIRKERDTLITFVCAAVDVARHAGTEEARARADAFEDILQRIEGACQ